MAIEGEVLDRLVELRLAGLLPRRTAVVELGAQQLTNAFLRATERLRQLGAVFGIDQPIELGVPTETHIAYGQVKHVSATAPSARKFWLWLGFEHAAIDIDGSPGSIPLDLNFDLVPPHQRGRYNLVTNFGTTEHVANQLNAFAVIHDLAAPNGLMMHVVPVQGFFNHGLVNYNLKFFWMLARSNGYRWIYTDYRHSAEPYNLPSNIVDFLREDRPEAGARAAQYQATDAGIFLILQKVFDMPFVPPLDVATGTKTDLASLRERYWPVFDPDAFARLQPRSNGAPAADRSAGRGKVSS